MTSYDPRTSGATAADRFPGAPVSAGRSEGDDRSVGEILGDIAGDLTSLVRQELDLAKTELKDEAGRAGKGAGMLGGAAIAGLLALIALTFTLIWLLDNWMPVELAALILTAVWGLVAAVLALRGRKELRQLTPPLETTQQTLKEDVQWARAQKNDS
ncbi:MAG TPA: phage holin family protein [Candidatus Limnocylindrales bacterium]